MTCCSDNCYQFIRTDPLTENIPDTLLLHDIENFLEIDENWLKPLFKLRTVYHNNSKGIIVLYAGKKKGTIRKITKKTSCFKYVN